MKTIMIVISLSALLASSVFCGDFLDEPYKPTLQEWLTVYSLRYMAPHSRYEHNANTYKLPSPRISLAIHLDTKQDDSDAKKVLYNWKGHVEAYLKKKGLFDEITVETTIYRD